MYNATSNELVRAAVRRTPRARRRAGSRQPAASAPPTLGFSAPLTRLPQVRTQTLVKGAVIQIDASQG
jgi:hypothetical protein